MNRLVDILAAGFGLAVASPLLAVSALAIKLEDGGPIVFRQTRVGMDGVDFELLKLRTMVVDAEQQGAGYAVDAGDNRITRVGKAIRKTSIDELPQLWNVVRGEMALVGPRPERPELVAEIAEKLPFYEPRHLVRPGITGWAQVYAPYAASIEETLEKLSYDLYYVKHQSFATDAGIMLSTLGVMAGGRGAR